MAETLPIIDLSALREGRPGALENLSDDLGRAAREVGFFYLARHGIDDALVARVFELSAAFFARPIAEKGQLSISRSPHNRGYVAMKGESLDPTKPADLKEAFNIGLDRLRTIRA